MSCQFDFENEVKTLMEDRPLMAGPRPRWQRKATERSGNGSFLNLSLNTSHLNGSLLSPSKANVVANKTPSKNKTPSTSFSKTPGKLKKSADRNQSLSKTPNKAADRFIANRQGTNFELGSFKIISDRGGEDAEDDSTLAQKEYRRCMSENLEKASGVTSNERILAFKSRPAAAEGYQNSSKVLYSSTKKDQKNRKQTRHIPTNAIRVLDAPDIGNDYYLNLLDWSSQNILAVVLRNACYLWNATSGDINLLMSMEGDNDHISSIKWVEDGNHIAIGNSDGEVQLWNVEHAKRIRNMTGHADRVGALTWNEHILSSGSRSGSIHHHDVRMPEHLIGTVAAHVQEVCGLEWSKDGFLASGGNDNMVNVYQGLSTEPLWNLTDHQAAVKAVGWCPWQSNLLATGGGSNDRHVRFWNTSNGNCIKAVDTKSQVCNLLWSRHYNELITAHGYSHNQLTVWSYPSMQWMQDLMGHTARVLYLAMSPDGQTVCSGAADETLRLWDCFSIDVTKKKKEKTMGSRSNTNSKLFSAIR